ncbi:hypothetical protein [Dongia sp.]|uniref:hypothetical protein n=1 Tax=Dongia sp. TaxID=1977262 RepID=UPI00375306EF
MSKAACCRVARRMHPWLGFLAGSWLATAAAFAGDLTEENMTQRDFNALTEMAPSGSTDTLEEAPTPVHNINEATEKFIKEPKPGAPPIGKKMIKGEDWKAETAEQRNVHIRNIRENAPPGSWVVISVPDGDVWVFFDAEQNYVFLNMYVVRQWGDWEKAELPVAVPRGRKVSQSDRRGGSGEGVAFAPKEP